jgi:hypothetical protein
MSADFRTCAPRVGLFLATLSLAACGSGEPSQSEMLQAIKASPTLHQQVGLMLMANLTLRASQSAAEKEQAIDKEISGIVVEKATCVEAQGAPGYMCDFRMGFPQADGQLQYGPPGKSRFFKTGAGWSVEDPR